MQGDAADGGRVVAQAVGIENAALEKGSQKGRGRGRGRVGEDHYNYALNFFGPKNFGTLTDAAHL